MTETVFKVILITVFALIFYQDTKERLVYWILYPVAGVLAFVIHCWEVGIIPAAVSSLMNLAFVSVLLLSGMAYARSTGRRFINESIGTGDILLFVFLAFSFSGVAFLVLFTFSLLFSLLMHLVFKNRHQNPTVPLAGYMSVFFAAVYCMSVFIPAKYLFSY